MIDVPKYAAQNGIKVAEVMEMIRSGHLIGVEDDGTWYVDTTASVGTFDNNYQHPLSARVLHYFAYIAFFSGLVIIATVWPSNIYGTELINYVPAIIWSIATVLECTLFVVFSQVVLYLSKIEFNTRKN